MDNWRSDHDARGPRKSRAVRNKPGFIRCVKHTQPPDKLIPPPARGILPAPVSGFCHKSCRCDNHLIIIHQMVRM